MVLPVVRTTAHRLRTRADAVRCASTAASVASPPKWNQTAHLVSSHGQLRSDYDAVIVGGGHNGLVCAAYLARAGLSVAVLERRHVLGGAAVTEEIVPGFKFSRASYLLSLLRPVVARELDLKRHGLRVHLRNPSSFTPLPDGRSLILGADHSANHAQISQFSVKDADNYATYEAMLDRFVKAIDPLLDSAPADASSLASGGVGAALRARHSLRPLLRAAWELRKEMPQFVELLTAPATNILSRWFESEPLLSTLATDAVIGAMASPYSPGSGYVLLHHVMGELEGVRGAWGYAEGGMGAVSAAIGSAAKEAGAHLFADANVAHVIIEGGRATGVALQDGTRIRARAVLSNATPQRTYVDLVGAQHLPHEFFGDVSRIDYKSPVTKINVAVNKLPNFTAMPTVNNKPGPNHPCTTHLGAQTLAEIHASYTDALSGRVSSRPVIEMCVPSALDPTIAPPGQHVITLFVQYTPYNLANGSWDDDGARDRFADKVFSIIDEYAPGFSSSVVGRDILTPVDLERIFGLTGGNIFHGEMSLHQLYMFRQKHRSPLGGLYLCGSGAHPGGGVMGAPGRNAAHVVIADLSRSK